MDKTIILKTDASFKNDIGTGVSFESTIYEGGMERKKIEDNKFLENIHTSTDAELLAVAFGVLETSREIENHEKYEIKVGSDCEYAVDVFNGSGGDQYTAKKIIQLLLSRFGDWRVRWIPRSTNERADALAKSALVIGEEERNI